MTYLALALIIAAFGAVLLIGEYFFAAHGILLVAAILCFFSSIAIIGVYGSLLELAVASVAGLVAIPLSTYGAVLMWKRVFGGEPSPAAEASIAEMPELQSLTELRGRVGQTISSLRPSGVVEFDGRRIDALSEGPMIDAGLWVKCVDVKPGKVIVRIVETNDEPPSASPALPPPQEPLAATVPSASFREPIDRPTTNTTAPPDKKKPDLNLDDWQIG